MADFIHSALSEFRDTILTSIARLEFQIRDIIQTKSKEQLHSKVVPIDLSDTSDDISEIKVNTTLDEKLFESIQEISSRILSLEKQFEKIQLKTSECMLGSCIEKEFMNMEPPENTRNILISSVRSTPALTAAVAAATANPPDFVLSEDEEEEVEEEEVEDEEDEEEEVEEEVEEEEVEEEEVEEVEVEVEEEEVEVEVEVEEVEVEEDEEIVEDEVEEDEEIIEEEEVEEENEELKKITIDGITYYVDSDKVVYHETQDGYEEIGTYNPKSNTIQFLDSDDAKEEEEVEEEVEEEEEETIQVEEFTYKNIVYERDSENNVYLNGERIGVWNGKKIV